MITFEQFVRKIDSVIFENILEVKKLTEVSPYNYIWPKSDKIILNRINNFLLPKNDILTPVRLARRIWRNHPDFEILFWRGSNHRKNGFYYLTVDYSYPLFKLYDITEPEFINMTMSMSSNQFKEYFATYKSDFTFNIELWNTPTVQEDFKQFEKLFKLGIESEKLFGKSDIEKSIQFLSQHGLSKSNEIKLRQRFKAPINPHDIDTLTALEIL